MPQLELFQIPSPCIGVCENGPNGFCYGCFRSRDERFYWTKLADEEKRHVIKLCKMRKRRWLAKRKEQEIESHQISEPSMADSQSTTESAGQTPDLFSTFDSDNQK